MTTSSKSESATPASSPARSVISASALSEKSKASTSASKKGATEGIIQKHGLNIALALSVTAILVSFIAWRSKNSPGNDLDKKLEELERNLSVSQRSLQQLKGDVEMLKNER